MISAKPEFTSYSSRSARGVLLGLKKWSCVICILLVCAPASVFQSMHTHIESILGRVFYFHAIFKVHYELVSLYKYCVTVIASKLQARFIYCSESVRLLATQRQLSAELGVVGRWCSEYIIYKLSE